MLYRLLFWVFSKLPFAVTQFAGGLLGRAVYWLSPRTRRRIRENLRTAFPDMPAAERARLAIEVGVQQGMALTELTHAWLRPVPEVAAHIRDIHGWEHIAPLVEGRRAMLFVMPHFGGYEFAGRYLHGRIPMHLMYRPPKLKALEPLMNRGRERAGGDAFTADLKGVRGILQRLQAGDSLIILPDQAPQGGNGVWADFFGKPAYTMTLVQRLAARSGAVPIVAFGVRRPAAGGFDLYLEPLPEPLVPDRAGAARQLNAAVERVARRWPAQYQWHYNRYKVPRGAPPPGENA